MIEIVQINANNLQVLSSVAAEVFDEAIDFERVAVLVAQQNQILLVALCAGVVIGQVLGVIHYHPDKRSELYIDDLAVAAAFQRQGIAKNLIAQLCVIAKTKGCTELWVAADPENEQAKGLYSSMGLSVETALIYDGLL